MTSQELYDAVRFQLAAFEQVMIQLCETVDTPEEAPLLQRTYCRLYGLAPSIRHLLSTGRPEDLAAAVRIVQQWQRQEAGPGEVLEAWPREGEEP